jgi:DNA-binding NarL/FixJ family response regulator
MILKVVTHIALVVKDTTLLSALSFSISGINHFKIIAEHRKASDYLKKISLSPPDILVLDTEALDSFDQLSYINELGLKTQVLVISDITDARSVIELISSGVSGYILRANCINEIVDGIQLIENRHSVLSPPVARKIMESFWKNNFSPLSHRESEVLKLMTLGCTYKDIAENLLISKETAKSHIRNIYGKLKVHKKAEVIQKAREERLV